MCGALPQRQRRAPYQPMVPAIGKDPKKFAQGPTARPMNPNTPGAGWKRLNGSGLQPLEMYRTGYLGRWPRLVWHRADGPKTPKHQRQRRDPIPAYGDSHRNRPKKPSRGPTGRPMIPQPITIPIPPFPQAHPITLPTTMICPNSTTPTCLIFAALRLELSLKLDP